MNRKKKYYLLLLLLLFIVGGVSALRSEKPTHTSVTQEFDGGAITLTTSTVDYKWNADQVMVEVAVIFEDVTMDIFEGAELLLKINNYTVAIYTEARNEVRPGEVHFNGSFFVNNMIEEGFTLYQTVRELSTYFQAGTVGASKYTHGVFNLQVTALSVDFGFLGKENYTLSDPLLTSINIRGNVPTVVAA